MLNAKDRKLLISKIQNYLDLNGDKTKILKLEDKIISFQDAELSLYWISEVSNCRSEEHLDIISATQDPEKMWRLLDIGHMKKTCKQRLARDIIASNNEIYIAKLLKNGLAKHLNLEVSVTDWLSAYGSKSIIYQTIMEHTWLNDFTRKQLLLEIYPKLTEEEKNTLKAALTGMATVFDNIEREIKQEQAYNEVLSLVNVLVPKETN